MKGHYIFSALLGIGLLLQGCETLDYTPADQLNDKTFWRTEQHANQAAVALYAAMKAGWAFGRRLYFRYDIRYCERYVSPCRNCPGYLFFIR